MPHAKASVDINLKLILSDEALPKVKGMYEISAPEDTPNIQILLNEFVKNLIGEDVIKTALKKAALKALVSDIPHAVQSVRILIAVYFWLSLIFIPLIASI